MARSKREAFRRALRAKITGRPDDGKAFKKAAKPAKTSKRGRFIETLIGRISKHPLTTE